MAILKRFNDSHAACVGGEAGGFVTNSGWLDALCHREDAGQGVFPHHL